MEIKKDQLDMKLTQNLFKGFLENYRDFSRLMAYYNCAMMEVETKLRVLNEEFSVVHDRNPIQSIKCRLKTPESIIEKIGRRGFEKSLGSIEENLNDVAGVRIICPFEADVYAIAASLITQDDVTLLQEKDYIKNPKANGYRSLHLIVEVPIYLAQSKKNIKVEIQIRTIAMDFWATLEHELRYKKQNNLSEEVSQELLECASISKELDRRMDGLREEVLRA